MNYSSYEAYLRDMEKESEEEDIELELADRYYDEKKCEEFYKELQETGQLDN